MANDYNFGIKISADGARQSARQIAGVEAELRKTQQATKDAEAAAKGLGDAYDLDENGIRAVAGAMQQLGTDTDKAAKSGGSLSNIIAGFAGGAAFAAVNALVGAVQQLGSAFVGLIASAGQQAAAFDDARAAASTLTDDTDTLIANLEQAQAGLNNQVGTTDLLAASYDVLSSGFTDAADAAEVTEQAARGAIAGFSDTATVADALTSILNAYGKEAGDAAQVVDQLVKTQDLGKITIDQYAQGVGRAASIAAQAGVKFETFSGAVATATAAGVPAESAISGVRQAIVNLLKPTDDGQKLLEKYGISSGAAALKTQDLDGVLRQLEDATPEELGKIFSDVDALATVATLAGDNVDSFVASIEGIDGAVGTADVAIGKITDTLNGQRRALEVSIQEGLLDFGQALEPAFEGILTLINDVFAAARESSDGFDPLIEAGERLQTVLEGNPEIAERLGEAFANLADQGIGALAGFVDAVTAFVSDQGNIDQYAQSIEALGGAITGIGNTIEFIIALVDGILQLRAAAADLPVIGGIVERLLQPFGQFALMRDLVQGLGNAFVNLRDTVINSVQGTVDAVGEAFPALEPLLNQIERILSGLGQNPDTQAFSGIADGAKGAAEGIENLQGVAEQAASQPKPELPVPTEEDTAEAETAYDRLANANRRALQQIAIDNANLRADRLEAGASAEEIEGIEANAFKRRIDANRQYLEQLRALEAQGGQNAEEAKKTADAIAQVEGQLAQDRVNAAQATVEAQKKAEQERIKAAEEAAKQVTDNLKAEREEQKRIAEEAFDTQQDRAAQNFEDQQRTEEQAFQDRLQAQEKAFQEQQQSDAQAFQDSQNAEQEAFQQRQQDTAKAFQRQQQAEAEAFQKQLDAERERGNREFDALASEVERRVQIANASSSEERKALKEQFKQEDEQRKQRNQIERQVLGQRGSVLGQADRRGELELSPLEQARADFEAELQERQRVFQEEQKLADEEFQLLQQEQELLFEEQQREAERAFEAEQAEAKAAQEEATREAERAFEEEQRQAERAFEEQQRQQEAAFKAEQRRLDEANARRIAAILRAAQAGRAPQARRMGGPVQPGQPYLVGEEGPELIFPSRAGYVATARETAAMMTAAMPAVHGVGMAGTGRVETLLENLLKEVKRGRAVNPGPTTYNVNTEAPQVDLRQLELDRMRDLLRLRGIP